MRVATTCKVCRRVGVSVCGREKCAIKRKPYPPGIHGNKFRRASSEFGAQLREKQKVRFLYGIRENQFKNLVQSALRQKSMGTPDAVILKLETRLDNVVYRLGFAPTRAASRQMVNHGHILVDGKRVTIPSYHVSVGEEVQIKPQKIQKGLFTNLDIIMKKHVLPPWLVYDHDRKSGRVAAHPPQGSLGDLGKGFNISAIIEYYAR